MINSAQAHAWIRFGLAIVAAGGVVWGASSRFSLTESAVKSNRGDIVTNQEELIHLAGMIEQGFADDDKDIIRFADRSRDQYFEVKNQVGNVTTMQGVIIKNQEKLEIRQQSNHSEIVQMIQNIKYNPDS